MMRLRTGIILIGLYFLFSSFALAVTITFQNPTRQAQVDAPVVIPITEEMRSISKEDRVLTGPEILPVQWDDLDGDGIPDELVTLVSIGAGESKQYTFQKNTCRLISPHRTHAGMYLKGFEGPGWESDRLAFRLYWDERNAMDIFCKKTPTLSLKQYAKPDVNYHIETPWGMDVLKVGPALGIGGFGIWMNGKIEKVAQAERDFKVIVDGPLRSIIDLEYTHWLVNERKFNLKTRISMIAGQKWCTVELWLDPLDDGPVPEWVTGVVKHEETTLIQDRQAGILGRWGLQALAPGEKPKGSQLGLGVVADPESIIEFGEDSYNSYMRLKSEEKSNHIRYRVHASWIFEPGGADSVKSYESMLRYLAQLRVETSFQ